MKLLKKKTNKKKTTVIQPCRKQAHPFSLVDRYNPSFVEFSLYRQLREAVPIIDAAILKIVRLVGGFDIKCDNAAVERELNGFLQNVRVGATGRGIGDFISTHLTELLTYGTAVGEIIDGSELSLYNAPIENVELRSTDGFDLSIVRRNAPFGFEIEHPELVLVSVLNCAAGNVYGESLLKGLPFVSGILLNIYNTIGTNFDRIGNVRFAVTYDPQSDNMDSATAAERAGAIAEEWSKTISPTDGRVRDFVAVGNVGIKAIGSDIELPDTQIPVRLLLEQIIAKIGIPPFLLGLSWSTTEKMSTQQTDILTSELEYYRRLLNPVITRICDKWMERNGRFEDFEIEWENINLQDEVEHAKANLYNVQAENILHGLNEN